MSLTDWVEVTTFGDTEPQYLYTGDRRLLQQGVYHDTDFHGGCHVHIRLNETEVLRTDGEKFWVAPLRVGKPVHRADECPK